MIQAGSVGKWYPVQQLDAQNGSWRIGKGIICPASGPLTLEVYLVPDSGGEAFSNTLALQTKIRQLVWIKLHRWRYLWDIGQ